MEVLELRQLTNQILGEEMFDRIVGEEITEFFKVVGRGISETNCESAKAKLDSKNIEESREEREIIYVETSSRINNLEGTLEA